MVWRPLNYAIVDEIDSILIDEARTPLIISEPNAEATEKYIYYAQIAKGLTPCTAKKKVSKGLLQELLTDVKSGKDQEEEERKIKLHVAFVQPGKQGDVSLQKFDPEPGHRRKK